MDDEIQALKKTYTWDLVHLPLGKTCSNGSVESYKAHLVVEGSTQEYGIDYEETFAPAVWITFMCNLLATVDVKHLKFLQMDVKNTFLNSGL